MYYYTNKFKMTNTFQKRDIWVMVANDEYRCVKLFMMIERNKWQSAAIYQEYYILHSLKEDYDAKKISILSPDFIANYKIHPFIEYFTARKMDELHGLLESSTSSNKKTYEGHNVFASVINDLDSEKEIQMIMAELELCRRLLNTSFPEVKKKLVKRKTADLEEQFLQREEIEIAEE